MDVIVEKKERKETIKKYSSYIDAIRRFHISNKGDLQNITKYTRPTIDKALKDFLSNSTPIMVHNNEYYIDENYGIFAGISVGATQIKVCIVNMYLSELSLKYVEDNQIHSVFKELYEDDVRSQEENFSIEANRLWFCYKREDTVESIAQRINKIISYLIKIDQFTHNMLSIGISFPGIIDSQKLTIEFCPNIKCLNKIHIQDLIYESTQKQLADHEIFLAFEHDTHAALLFEREYMYKLAQNDYTAKTLQAKNICCVYIAAGISASMVINNQLYRGGTNAAGEIGHLPAPNMLEVSRSWALTDAEMEDKKALLQMQTDSLRCDCRVYNCLESSFRRDVFGTNNINLYLETINNAEFLRNLNWQHPFRYRLLKEYLGYIIGLLINTCNPDLIIFSGRILREVEPIQYDLKFLRPKYSIDYIASNCTISLGSQKVYSAAAGTAISAYYCALQNKSFCDMTWC